MWSKVASNLNTQMDSAGDRVEHGIHMVAESRDDHVHESSHLVECVARHVTRMRQAVQPMPPFVEVNVHAEVVAMEYKESAGAEDVSHSTLFAASETDRAALQDRGLRQLLLFPLCNAEGQCWGAVAAYNYTTSTRWSLKDLTACESICSTTSTKFEMLQTLQKGARKSKLINLQHDLLDRMQRFHGVDVLKGLVSSASVSLLNVVRHSTVCPVSPRLPRAPPILTALPPFRGQGDVWSCASTAADVRVLQNAGRCSGAC